MDTKIKLAQAYGIIAHLGLDDHTYTHLSARAEDGQSFYIYPFGLRFNEVRPETLLRVSFDGEILEGREYQYNRTGYIIHGHVYKARSDLQAVFHLHTPAMVAVSVLEEGLLALSQWALHFYERIAYHPYDSLALDANQGQALINDLADKSVMLLRHHGGLMCGKTIEEAMFYTHHLELACKTQIQILSMNRPIVPLARSTCLKTVKDLLSFEKNLGSRDWQAWVRWLEKFA